MKQQLLKAVCALIIFLPGSLLFAQTDSRYDAGLNLPFNEKAGDVNPQTGNLTLGAGDVSLPGRAGMNFSFGRSWALNQSNAFTMSRDPVTGANRLSSETIEKYNNLGVGWSANTPYVFKDYSSGNLVVNLFFGGNVYEVDQSGINRDTAIQESNLLGYDLTDLRFFGSAGRGYGEFNAYLVSDLQSGYGVANQITEHSAYVLILKDNSRYWFLSNGRLMLQEDKTGLNRIWYFYNADEKLCLVVDTIGRKIRFSYDTEGNLAEITWDVELGEKEAGTGVRSRNTVTRSIQYLYESAETFTQVAALSGQVIGYETPYVLTGVVDAMGNVTRYEYEAGSADFTYNSLLSHSTNVYLLLTAVADMYTEADGKYKAKRCFEYAVPEKGMHTRYFYNGYMEYFRISREYNRNRHGRIMKNTRYIYHEEGEAGNHNQYTTVIEQGNTKTTYTYSLSSQKNQDQVLDKLLVETADGFIQETDFSYNDDRAKTLEEVRRKGQFIYRQKYSYDSKGNLKRLTDRMGLVVAMEYDKKYSLPIREVKILNQDTDDEKQYITENVINGLGQVIRQMVYLKQPDNGLKAVTAAAIGYDAYGNPVSQTDAAGVTVHTVFDEEYHAFPVKIYQDVSIAAWSGGGTVHENWLTDPDAGKLVRIRSWKVFNSDGTVWIEIDNEGYAREHYYDANGVEIETVNPDSDDVISFAEPIEVVEGTPQGADFTDFLTSSDYAAFLASRVNNPGVRMVIDYQNEFVKSYADIDVTAGTVKVTGVQKDGLGNTEAEIEYGESESEYAVKRMEYDDLGRMVAMTDPDAGTSWVPVKVNGVSVKRYEKTWLVRYDDLGRKLRVWYPDVETGKSQIKQMIYNDLENSVVTVDPENRQLYEKQDWNGNVVEVTAYGDMNTPQTEVQTYSYTYDQLKRKTSFTDAKGIVTKYSYDERNLLLEQVYENGKDVMTYNDLGQLVKKTDRKGQVLTFVYDQLGRNTSVRHYRSAADYANGVLDHKVDTEYDNRGNAVRISNENLIEHYIYNYANAVTTLERRVKDEEVRSAVASVWGGDEASQVFGFSYEYNDAGMVKSMTYPDGSVHAFSYDDYLARLTGISEGADSGSVTDFVTGLEYNKSGVVARMDYANGTCQEWSFDNRKRIAHIGVTGPGGIIEDLHYTLNGDGDILAINENEYAYDGFDRIVGAKTLLPGMADQVKLVSKYFGTYQTGDPVNGVSYEATADLNSDGRVNGADHLIASLQDQGVTYDVESFTYDKNGNRTKLVQNGIVYTYEYGIMNQLKKVWRKSPGDINPEIFVAYNYDANGNLVKRTVYNDEENEVIDFEYDTLNRLVKTTEGGAVTEYFYDNAGNRFIKQLANGDLTLYLRHGQIAVAMDVEVNGDQASVKGKKNRYVLSGDLLAGRVTVTVNADDSTVVDKSWYHLDHLNSTKCVTDEAGVVEVRYVYRAFGEQLRKLDAEGEATTDKAKYSYGGKELDEVTNLYYFNARYYDATIGRFINVDPIQDGTNWYVYCGNNPLSSVDPTGLTDINLNISVYAISPENISHYTKLYAENQKRLQLGNNIIAGILGVSTGVMGIPFGKIVSTISAVLSNGYTFGSMAQPSGWDQVTKLSDFREKYEAAMTNGRDVKLTMALSTQTVTLADNSLGKWKSSEGIINSEKRIEQLIGPFYVERTYSEHVYKSSIVFTASWIDENNEIQVISYSSVINYDMTKQMKSNSGNSGKLHEESINGKAGMAIGGDPVGNKYFSIFNEQWGE